MDRPPPPDGYEWTSTSGLEMRLIDPGPCPGGHPLTGQRGFAPCVQHRGHPKWTCGCGLEIYRVEGGFATELQCR